MANEFWRVEFHCHTHTSSDSLIDPARLIAVCQQRGIDRIVITDHNRIKGALEAQAIDPVRVIIGEEIMTTKGELLAAFVKEEIPPGLSPLETIRRLREQDAFISVSHPFDDMRKGHWEKDDLLEIISLVDAIEIFNSRCFSTRANDYAKEFTQEHGLLGTVGSDAHGLIEVGRSTLLLSPFTDATSLKQNLAHSKAEVRSSSFAVHFISRYARWMKYRQKEAR